MTVKIEVKSFFCTFNMERKQAAAFNDLRENKKKKEKNEAKENELWRKINIFESQLKRAEINMFSALLNVFFNWTIDSL